MLFIFGKRRTRIAKYIDSDSICYPCKASDREVRVYMEYFHLCFIPVFPIGGKQIEMRCRNCGDETKLESVEQRYLSLAKTPFYFYSALILCVCVGTYWFYWNRTQERQKREFVDKPSVADVYIIKKGESDEATYTFLRIVKISGDSIMVFHNDLEYGGFVSKLTDDDYFVKDDTLVLSKSELIEMLDRDEIYSVKRGYGNGGGFNRIR